MKTVTRNLLFSYSSISSDQLVELYCRTAEVVVAIGIHVDMHYEGDDHIRAYNNKM